MDKFARPSLNLCLSCVQVIARSLSLRGTQSKLYFSTHTKSHKNKQDTGYQSSTLLQAHLQNKQSLEIPLLRNNVQNVSRQHTTIVSNSFCQRFSGLCSRRTITVNSTTALENNVDLLLRAGCVSPSSVRHYSTDTPGAEPPSSKKTRLGADKSPISWKNLLVFVGVGSLLLIFIQYLKTQKELERKKARNRLIGKANLGGDWTLTDHHGNRRSSTEFRGQWLLIYFGFTHCPDVCPEEIEKIVNVINMTDANENLPKIQPVIITVDPERDTPQALKEYCAEFSPRLLGFTGSPEEIQQATHAYRVYFSAGPKDDDSDYIVDHSIISYLVSPEGEFVDYFGQNKTVNEIYNSIQFHIGSYLKQERSRKQDKA